MEGDDFSIFGRGSPKEHFCEIILKLFGHCSRWSYYLKKLLTDGLTDGGHFHIKLEVQKMQFWGLISSQNNIYCSILHLHSKHMVVFYKR